MTSEDLAGGASHFQDYFRESRRSVAHEYSAERGRCWEGKPVVFLVNAQWFGDSQGFTPSFDEQGMVSRLREKEQLGNFLIQHRVKHVQLTTYRIHGPRNLGIL